MDCLHLGAADFLLKPISLSELQARVSRALEKRALVLQNRFYQQHLEQQVQAQATRIQELFLQGVQMLARALEAKDAYTRGHSMRVSQYAVATASRLGFTGQGLEGIRLGGELHDIGKIGTREAVLHKPTSLTPEEFRQITEHPALGERMLSPLAHESPDVLKIVRSHHERLDGRGFPDGLRGEKIPIEARIVAVADSFDAMTTRRPYREARPPVRRHGRASQGSRHAARPRGGGSIRRFLPGSECVTHSGLRNRAYNSRSMVRIRMASPSISRRLATVSGSIFDSFKSSSWVSASRAESGLERSWRSLLSRSVSFIVALRQESREVGNAGCAGWPEHCICRERSAIGCPS